MSDYPRRPIGYVHHSIRRAEMNWRIRARNEGFASEVDMWLCLAPTVTYEELGAMWHVAASTVMDRIRKHCPQALERKPSAKNRHLARKDDASRFIKIRCKFCDEEYLWDTFYVRKAKYKRTYCDKPGCVLLNNKKIRERFKERHGPRVETYTEEPQRIKYRKTKKLCPKCGKLMSGYNKGPVCHACDGRACGLLGRESRDEFTIRQNR